jgi:hypothetical protein
LRILYNFFALFELIIQNAQYGNLRFSWLTVGHRGSSGRKTSSVAGIPPSSLAGVLSQKEIRMDLPYGSKQEAPADAPTMERMLSKIRSTEFRQPQTRN